MKKFVPNPLPYIISAFFFTLIFLGGSRASAQSSISLGGGINQPLQSGYGIGGEVSLQYNIKVLDKLYIDPALGYAELNTSNNFQTSNWKLYKLGLGGKYYVTTPLFVRAGAFVQLEKDPYVNTGGQIGALIGAGYDIALSQQNLIEVSLKSDFWRPTHRELKLILGLSVAYKFRFSR